MDNIKNVISLLFLHIYYEYAAALSPFVNLAHTALCTTAADHSAHAFCAQSGHAELTEQSSAGWSANDCKIWYCYINLIHLSILSTSITYVSLFSNKPQSLSILSHLTIYCQYSSSYMDIILTLFVALVLQIGVECYDIMKIVSFSHHTHLCMVLTLNVVTVFVAALFCTYA